MVFDGGFVFKCSLENKDDRVILNTCSQLERTLSWQYDQAQHVPEISR